MKITDLKRVKLLLLDVDGVLTNGDLIYNDQGAEAKAFNVKDGVGLRLLMGAGVKVGIVTGRRSEAMRHRCRNLGITIIYDDVRDKAAVLDSILTQAGVTPEEIAFIGDDLLDLPIMRKVGLSIAVADAVSQVRQKADMVTTALGGRGAVREVCEAILQAQGHWEKIIKRYTGESA